MSIQNSYVQFSDYINVNSIKIEKIEKEVNSDTGAITLKPKTFAEVTDEGVRDRTSINTVLFTTFNIASERSVEAFYFPPKQQLSNAIISVYKKTPIQTYYDFVCELDNGASQVYDYNIKSNTYYHYLVAALVSRGDNTTAQSYIYYIYDNKDKKNNELYFKPRFDSWCICNVEETTQENVYMVVGDTWNLGFNLGEEDITQNYGVTSWDTLGRYSKFSQGTKNYASASFSGLLGNFKTYKKYNLGEQGNTDGVKPVTVCEYTEKLTQNKNAYALETEKLDAWLEFCSDGSLKLLRDIKGNAWLIQIADSHSYNINNSSNLKQTSITFSWKEAEDINKCSIIGLD